MDGKIVIGTEINTKEFDAQIEYIEEKMLDIEDKIKQADMGFEVGDTLKLEADYERLGNQLLLLRERQEKYNQSIRDAQHSGLVSIQSTLSNIDNSMQKITKRVARWALAVFGVRSMYMFVRNAINTIAQDDEQLRADIDGIRVALAYTIEPIVRGIVNLAKQLMGYLAYIVKAWTGRDIFAKSAKSIAGAAKSAKELQKSSFAFDKFNKLSSSSNTAGGGGVSSSLEMPDKVPGWIDWIAQNKDGVLAFVAGLTTALISLKLLGLDPIVASGLGVFVAGAILLFKDFNKMLEDGKIDAKELGVVFSDLGIIIGGLMLISGNWIGALVAGIALIVRLVIENWDKIKAIFSTIGNWIKTNVINPTVNAFTTMRDKIVTLFKNIGTKVGEVVGGAFKAVINGVLKAIETILNAPIRTINSLISTINKVPGINLNKLSTFNLPRLERGGIVHNPGSGVMMGSYVAGEGRSPEAVIPLDDATLDRLGQAIARHSQINATIVNEMDGRVLSKNLAKINNENVFARNGGY